MMMKTTSRQHSKKDLFRSVIILELNFEHLPCFAYLCQSIAVCFVLPMKITQQDSNLASHLSKSLGKGGPITKMIGFLFGLKV